MKIIETKIDGLYILEPKVFGDDRGYFFESYNKDTLQQLGINDDFVQDNESLSSYGVLRGLHYQLPPYTQSKLVRVIEGSVLDVAVDIRKGSKTFGEHIAVELSGENKLQFYISRGFAHGFVVLTETAKFAYKCDNYYNPSMEAGIIYNDKNLHINWRVKESDIKLSDKDRTLLTINDITPCELNYE